MPTVRFTHPSLDTDLVIETGANEITWGYNLNTVSYPTYAGEVVQVLSVNIDDLEIVGEVKSYTKMEEIFRWFLLYMQKATQGNGGDAYIEYPVKMEYPHRGWTMFIKPKSLPALRYGRDVVIPSWQVSAHVEDPDPEQRTLAIDHAINGDVENWKARVSANIGFRQASPFSDPQAVITKEEATLYPKAKDLQGIKVENTDTAWSQDDIDELLDGVGKQMTEMFKSLMGGSYKDIIEAAGLGTEVSSPAKGGSGSDNSESEKPGH